MSVAEFFFLMLCGLYVLQRQASHKGTIYLGSVAYGKSGMEIQKKKLTVIPPNAGIH